jgi:aminoglycoside phosphotransferase (APT) family kinase protein
MRMPKSRTGSTRYAPAEKSEASEANGVSFAEVKRASFFTLPMSAVSNKSERKRRQLIHEISLREFGVAPENILRMRGGICNEVYQISLERRELIVRMNAEERFLLGSHNHIPLFKAKGIRVPDILAEDYSKQSIPYAYQILTGIEGRDIGNVIDTLSDEQLRAIAGEVSRIFRRLRDVGTNGRFGVLWGDERELVTSWTSYIRKMSEVVAKWGKQTGVYDENLARLLKWINEEYEAYFDSVDSLLYFGDICGKNVMIHEGRFNGLVDLDALAQGDYLEAIGRIKASWYGTHHGNVYTEALMGVEGLNDEQRKTVTMYALLNRIFWACENGVQFNSNTTSNVDWGKAKKDKEVIEMILTELKRQ